MLNLQWLQVTMYPAGYYTRQIPIEASVKLPEELEAGHRPGNRQDRRPGRPSSRPRSGTLVDSPIFAGKYFKSIDLDPTGPVPVRLNLVADSQAAGGQARADPDPQGPRAAGLQAVRLAPLRPLPASWSPCRTRSAASAWSTTARPRTAWSPSTSPSGTRASSAATC
ncbi:hypothetical protein ACRAWD_28240 [Caulobacter segnis]